MTRPPQDTARPTIPLYLLSAVLTLVIVGGMLFVLKSGANLSNKLAPLAHATAGIQLEAALAHLWLEEAVSSNPSNAAKIWPHLDKATWFAHAILEGGEDEYGIIEPMGNPDLRDEIHGVLVQLKAFRNVSNQILALGASPGSEIDKTSDALFSILSSRTNAVERMIRDTIQRELTVFNRIQVVLLVFGLLLAAIVGTLFFRFHQGQAIYVRMLKQRDEQLRRHAVELERSNRELEQFAYVASHDLREPLRKIQAFGDRLKDKEAANLGERGHDYVDRMVNAAHRMQALIEDLLLYSRCGSRTEPFSLVDLNQIAKTVLSDLETSIQESHATIDVGRLPKVYGDTLQLGQLFQNLISNALKFQPKGRAPTLTIRAEQDEHGTRLRFTDNGIGIHEDHAERIFGVFQRLHGRDEYQGTGVGLSICKKVAERHGGGISLQSLLGDGTTFTVFLPTPSATLKRAA